MTVSVAEVTLGLLKVMSENHSKNMDTLGDRCEQWAVITHRHFAYKTGTQQADQGMGDAKICEKNLPNQKEESEVYRMVHLYGTINK